MGHNHKERTVTELTLDHTEDDAKLLIKAAFENTPRIKKYTDQGQSIVGETGLGLMSYGANITVDISEHPINPNKTPISVRGEKKVFFNITNDHNKTKARFIEALNGLRKYPIEDVVDVLSEQMGVKTNVTTPKDDMKADGSGLTVVGNDKPMNKTDEYDNILPHFSSDQKRLILKVAIVLFVGWVALNILAAIIDFLVVV